MAMSYRDKADTGPGPSAPSLVPGAASDYDFLQTMDVRATSCVYGGQAHRMVPPMQGARRAHASDVRRVPCRVAAGTGE